MAGVSYGVGVDIVGATIRDRVLLGVETPLDSRITHIEVPEGGQPQSMVCPFELWCVHVVGGVVQCGCDRRWRRASGCTTWRVRLGLAGRMGYLDSMGLSSSVAFVMTVVRMSPGTVVVSWKVTSVDTIISAVEASMRTRYPWLSSE